MRKLGWVFAQMTRRISRVRPRSRAIRSLLLLAVVAAMVFVAIVPVAADGDEPVGVRHIELAPTGFLDPWLLDASGMVTLKTQSGPDGTPFWGGKVTVEFDVERLDCQSLWILGEGDDQPERSYALYLAIGHPLDEDFEWYRLQSFNTNCRTNRHSSFLYLTPDNGFDPVELFSAEVTFSVSLEFDNGMNEPQRVVLSGGMLEAVCLRFPEDCE